MRTLDLIKESDLNILSNSIVELFRTLFEFETHEVSTRFFPYNTN